MFYRIRSEWTRAWHQRRIRCSETVSSPHTLWLSTHLSSAMLLGAAYSWSERANRTVSLADSSTDFALARNVGDVSNYVAHGHHPFDD